MVTNIHSAGLFYFLFLFLFFLPFYPVRSINPSVWFLLPPVGLPQSDCTCGQTHRHRNIEITAGSLPSGFFPVV
ncbi:hypothetical protein B0J18DRAFT_223730 [Chaetomium sp. MPI-SDFR-AT-0129]|nr:hypothetical protein B0J18DRAFT_223730 [Chaetomium sp. MPI-SDFR-AT-0129]